MAIRVRDRSMAARCSIIFGRWDSNWFC